MFAGYVNQYLGTAPPRGGKTATAIDDSVPADWWSGWYYAFSRGYMKRDYIQECFVENHDLTTALSDVMDAFLTGDNKTASTKALEVEKLFRAATVNCTDILDKVTDFRNKWDTLTSRDDWSQIAAQIYEDHKA